MLFDELFESAKITEGVNAKQIKKDLDSGMSHDAVIGKHANKRMTNTDEIRRVIQQHAWEKRMKRPKEQGVQEGLPAHIKKSDVPPAMRPRLSMKDIEAERPKGAYRYRVIPGTPGESPKDFLDQAAAQTFAKQVGGRVQPLEEQQLDEMETDIPNAMSPVNRGLMIIQVLQDDLATNKYSRRPLTFNLGGRNFDLSDTELKLELMGLYKAYKKKGTEEQFLLNLGQPDGLTYIISRAKTAMQNQDVGVAGQGAAPRARRYAAEESDQKKSSEGGLTNVSARTRRMLDTLRSQQPQAKSDIEALTYAVRDSIKKQKQDTEKLERERDDLERDIRSDLEKTVGSLRGRKGVGADALKAVQFRNQQQTDAINRIMKIDQEQQRAIDDLEKTVKTSASSKSVSPAATPQALPTPSAGPVARTAEPAASTTPSTAPASQTTSSTVNTAPIKLKRSPSPKKKSAASTPTVKRPMAKKTTNVIPFPRKQGELGFDEPSLADVVSAAGAIPKTGTYNLEERQNSRSARIERILKMLRARNPQAQDDLEALLLNYRADQAHDQQEIDRLDAENDQEEADIDALQNIVKQRMNESLWSSAESAALAKFHTKNHPAFSTFAESWYRAHGGV